MKKNVWIINHYANHMLEDCGGRHYWIAKYLGEKGYNCTVFSSNIRHGREGTFCNNKKLYNVKEAPEISAKWIFVKGTKYSNNGLKRVINMVNFYFNCIKAGIKYSRKFGKPDIIYASSAHPLALVAGIQLARKFGIKCISEVRDLWPESIVAYSNKFTEHNALIRMLYMGEKWIYLKSDRIIMTWPGGYDYITEKGWDKLIPKNKVVQISNGVDNASFCSMIEDCSFCDADLDSSDFVKFIYTGSIRKVNALGALVEADNLLEQRGFFKHKIIIFGGGDQLDALRNRVEDLKLKNIVFKGKIDKGQVPGALHKANYSILHNTSTSLDKYGQSQNKLFEYLAAGHPILMTYSVGYSIIKSNDCGIELDEQSPETIANAIAKLCGTDKETYERMSINCIQTAKEYDFSELTKKLIDTIEGI